MIGLLIKWWWAPVILALCLGCAVMVKVNDGLRDKLAAFRAQAETYRAAQVASEAARKIDQAAAMSSYEGLQSTCTANVAAALERGKTIERILYRPAPAGGGRAVVSADELRQLVGQADDSAAGLH